MQKHLQREKGKSFSNILQTAENDCTQGIINFFKTIKKFKQFNLIWNAIRDQDGQMLMEPDSKVKRLKLYFEKILNGTV